MKSNILKLKLLIAICIITIKSNGQQLITNKIINQNVYFNKNDILSKSGIKELSRRIEKNQLNDKKVKEYRRVSELLKNSTESKQFEEIKPIDSDSKVLRSFIENYNTKIQSKDLTEEFKTELAKQVSDAIDKEIKENEEGDPEIEFNCDTCFEAASDGDCVKIVGSASLNDLASVSSSNGTMSFGGYFRLGKRSGLYMFFNTKPSASSDSSSIGKTFIFPELSSRDFIVGYSYARLYNKNWTGSFFGEISLCKHSNIIDTTKNVVDFNSTQLILGMRFSKSYFYTINKKPHSLGFSFIPYLQGISVSSKYAESYRKTLDGFKDTNGGNGSQDLPLGLFAAGIRGQIDFEDFSFFCNTKFPLNTSSSGNINNELKQFVYTIGVAITPKIIGF